MIMKTVIGLGLVSSLIGCEVSSPASVEEQALFSRPPETALSVDLRSNQIKHNPYAYIPAQCYTKTQANDRVHNPCFACHAAPVEPNYIEDATFQLAYEFRESTLKNLWTNLFKDRTDAIKAISDAQMQAYVNESNYFNQAGEIALTQTLNVLPKNWDFDGNGKWDGYLPDAYFNFDSQGFDVAPNGDDSGWRAFAYSPFLGTFWPTNGSTDDVLIRLPQVMQQTEQGVYSRAVYHLNLSMVVAMIQRKNIPIPLTDERLYGVDLNKNGQLDKASEIVYDWAPLKQRFMSYVGKAKQAQAKGKLHLAAGLYPEGTEFLHSVRYLAVNNNQQISLSPRLKELRYAKKRFWNTYPQLKNAAMAELKEGHDFPERLRRIKGDAEFGLSNGQGWIYQGFIEAKNGELRPQNFEETLACIGCHSGISVTTDSSFALPRKLGDDAYQAGWYHWSQRSLAGLPEPKFTDGGYQYTEYLKQNQSANEFRTNDEVMAQFWNQQGQLKPEQLSELHHDIATLLMPSVERAMQLNKAYKVIVDEQSFIYGRDAHIGSLEDSVWQTITQDEPTGVKQAVIKYHAP